MATVVRTVVAGDPRVLSIILTGGFARGEGSFLGGKPQNDYDFVAVRGFGRSRVPYGEMRASLEAELGLHIDLAPIPAWRLGWVAHSIFWYETAESGRVLHGRDLLSRIPVRRGSDIHRSEGLRLLVNRAAGLLLVGAGGEAPALRLQAAKALLAASDIHLLSKGLFVSGQMRRWRRFEALEAAGSLAPAPDGMMPWFRWAIGYKMDPGGAPVRPGPEAWRVARDAVLQVVPMALAHAGLATLDEYAGRDGVADRLAFFHRSRALPGARRLMAHPTGSVRAATLALLESAPHGRIPPDAATRHLGWMMDGSRGPVAVLEAMRAATLQ